VAAGRPPGQPGRAPAHPVPDRPGDRCLPGRLPGPFGPSPVAGPVRDRPARHRPRSDRGPLLACSPARHWAAHRRSAHTAAAARSWPHARFWAAAGHAARSPTTCLAQLGHPTPRAPCLSAAQRGCSPVRLLGRSDRAADRPGRLLLRSTGLAAGWAVFLAVFTTFLMVLFPQRLYLLPCYK
jgi:hypothetical protein